MCYYKIETYSYKGEKQIGRFKTEEKRFLVRGGCRYVLFDCLRVAVCG